MVSNPNIGVADEKILFSYENMGSNIKILWSHMKILGSHMTILGSPMRISGSPTKLQVLGLRRVSNNDLFSRTPLNVRMNMIP